jgi:hypothetical protein
VVEGLASLEVSFSGELVGGPDDNPDYYCVERTFNFGDGISQSTAPDCVEWQAGVEIERRYTANYVYDEPGEYRVTFSLGDIESEPVVIMVSEAADEAAGNEPASTQSLAGSPAETPAARTATEEANSTGCLLGLLPLSLLGVVSWRRRY